MSSSSTATPDEQTLYAALELSKNSWLLAVQFPGRDSPSLHPIKGGDADGLMAKLDAARQRLAKVSGRVPKVTLCSEAGYDGFWLARFLERRGVDCRVMDPASLQVDRRARRVKTDRIDVEKLLHTLIAWCRGERHVCSMVVIPSVKAERPITRAISRREQPDHVVWAVPPFDTRQGTRIRRATGPGPDVHRNHAIVQPIRL